MQSIFQPSSKPSFAMPLSSGSNTLAGTLGSIIGYLGSESAEPALFERLLWPQRFYHQTSLGGVLKSAFLMQMGGPIHKAALEVLERFRKKGLYRGMQRGHMLGTAFFPNSGLRYKLHGYQGADLDDEVRNGLWIGVMYRLQQYQSDDTGTKASGGNGCGDQEKQQPPVVRRTTQRVNHLRLSVTDAKKLQPAAEFCEDAVSLAAPLTILASEISAVACAIVILLAEERCYWFAAYLCIPLLLKLLSIPCSVRRDPVSVTARSSNGPEILVEITDYDHGFQLISGPEEIVRQFFRHWGHPARQNGRDRVREVCSMILVMVFVLCFPVGLLSMLWVNGTVQVVWLSYQMYTIVAMHINRLLGFEGSGRLEDCLADELAKKGIARLCSKNGGVVQAHLSSVVVSRMKEGQEKVREIVMNHAREP